MAACSRRASGAEIHLSDARAREPWRSLPSGPYCTRRLPQLFANNLRERIRADRGLLDQLRRDVCAHLATSWRILPRSTTAISLVGTDGGNNRVEFDPFLAQVIRVVDSSNNEYCFDIVTPTSDRKVLSLTHLDKERKPLTPLGRMMSYLGVEHLWELTPMIARPDREAAPSWVQVYRELTEWAVLFCIVREKDFGTDTVIVCDGFLRSKVQVRLFLDPMRPIMYGLVLRLEERAWVAIHAGGCGMLFPRLLPLALAASLLVGSLPHLASAYTGGPVRARILGYDPRDARVFYELKAFDESGQPPRTYFFHLTGATPTIPVRADSLDDWEGDVRVRSARQRWLELYPRLVPLPGVRDTEFSVRVHAESTGVDTSWSATRFATHVEIRTPAGARTFDLQTFCQPIVRVQGVRKVPGRQELVVIVSYIGRDYGCEEVDLPVLFVPR